MLMNVTLRMVHMAVASTVTTQGVPMNAAVMVALVSITMDRHALASIAIYCHCPLISSSFNWFCVVKSYVDVTGTSSLEELETLTLHCTANPPASISWLKRTSKGIKTISTSSRITISTQETTTKNGLSITHSTLMIRDVTEVDSADYVCEADNGAESIPTAKSLLVNIHGII